MAYNKKLADRLRQSLAHMADVKEQKMFGGLAFMVNGKMCMTVRNDRIMCRIGPEIYEDILKTKKCSTVIMRGNEYKGYIYVDGENLQLKDNLSYWIDLALAFNKKLSKSE